MGILNLVLAATLVIPPASAPRGDVPGVGLGLSTPTSGYVRVDADSIFYEVAGKGPALILIHDGLIHREIWDAQFQYFADRFTVVRYDRRGYGNSPPPSRAYSDLRDLEALYARLNIQSAGLIAMSSGGRLAIDFTLAHPDLVTSLVLVGAVVRGFSYTTHFYSRGGHLPQDLSPADSRRWYAGQDPYEIDRENVMATARALELVERAPHVNHVSVPGSVAPPPAALPRLGEIAVPTLLLVGEFDMPDVHAHAGAINAGIPGSVRQVIPHAGHLIPLEQPGLFNEAVTRFLEESVPGVGSEKPIGGAGTAGRGLLRQPPPSTESSRTQQSQG
jgi:3-oxoadipate enol-lactonase